MRYLVTWLLLFALAPSVSAKKIRSPEVHADGTVTFRLMAPYAASVKTRVLRVDGGEIELTEHENGLWEGSVGPLPPGIYEYLFEVDGTVYVDPRNRWVKKWFTMASLFEVEADPPLVTQLQRVPHGSLHQHTYFSNVAHCERGVVIYTPPSYEKHADHVFPVLFLLHGFGDDQTAWTEVGRAHYIADNLIADHKIKEMVIVMPFGHPLPMPFEEDSKTYTPKNNPMMVREIGDVLLPWVSEHYRVAQRSDQRAIAGLSMGGGHAIRAGMGLNRFDWIGAFSAAAPEQESLGELAPELEQLKKQLKLFWIACGDKDFLVKRNHEFVAKLKDAEVPHQYVETEGSHNWNVWRDEYLPQFLQLIFQ